MKSTRLKAGVLTLHIEIKPYKEMVLLRAKDGSTYEVNASLVEMAPQRARRITARRSGRHPLASRGLARFFPVEEGRRRSDAVAASLAGAAGIG